MSYDEHLITQAGGDGDDYAAATSAQSMEWAIFRAADDFYAEPFDSAKFRSGERAEEYMKSNYVESAWKWLEVRKRLAPTPWMKAKP